nr:Uncharacterised protein [Klebsiella pneumoniae]
MRGDFVENYHVSINATAVAEGITKIFPVCAPLRTCSLISGPAK